MAELTEAQVQEQVRIYRARQRLAADPVEYDLATARMDRYLDLLDQFAPDPETIAYG